MFKRFLSNDRVSSHSRSVDIPLKLRACDDHTQLKQYSKALIDLDAILSVYPNYNDALRRRITIYFHLNQDSDALHDLNIVLNDAPTDIVALKQRVDIYIKCGRREDAVMDLNTILDINPTHVQALQQRTNIYFYRNQYDKALLDVNVLLRINPRDANILRQRIFIYSQLNILDKIIMDVNTLLELPSQAPLYKLLHLERAQVYIKLNDLESGLSDLNNILSLPINLCVPLLGYDHEIYGIELNTLILDALIERMKLYSKQDKLDDALGDVAILLDLIDPYLHNKKRSVEERLSKEEHLIMMAALSKALIFRATIYLKQDESEKALKDLNDGLKADPTNSNLEILNHRHTLFKKLGNDKQAVLDEYAIHSLNFQSGKIPSLGQCCAMAIYKGEPRIHANGNVFALNPVRVRHHLAQHGINRVTLAAMQEKLNHIQPIANKKTIFDQMDGIQTGLVDYENIMREMESLRRDMNTMLTSFNNNAPHQIMHSNIVSSAELPSSPLPLSYVEMREKRLKFFGHQNHSITIETSQNGSTERKHVI